MSTVSRITRVVAVALTIGIVTGCASMNERIDQAMTMAQQASKDAAAAKQSADSSSRAASEAKSAAANAQSAADRAQRSADQANSCCAANSEKIERMFKESMKK